MPLPTDNVVDLLARNMSMRQMRMLVAVAEQRSVVRAGSKLRVAQPAISRAVRELERALGVTLFERLPQGMTLTVFGEVLLRHIRAIFGELRDAGEELQSLQDASYGQVTIGCTRLLIAGVLPRALSAFMRAHPRINVTLSEANTTTLIGELRARNLDIVLGRLPASADREGDLEYKSLFDEKLALVAAPDHPIARRKNVSLSSILHETWVLPLRNSMLFRVIAETLSRNGLSLPAVRAQVESPRIMFELVATANMIALAPMSHLIDADVKHRLVVVSRMDAIRYGPIGYVTLRAKEKTPATSAFISVLRREIPVILGALRAPKPPR